MIKFTKQIEVRMSKGSSLYNTFVCHDGIDAATIPCEEEWADEVVKRINMHDELVSMLKDIALVDGGSECIKSKIARARELLEKCK